MSASTRFEKIIHHAGNILRATQSVDLDGITIHHGPSVVHLQEMVSYIDGEIEALRALGLMEQVSSAKVSLVQDDLPVLTDVDLEPGEHTRADAITASEGVVGGVIESVEDLNAEEEGEEFERKQMNLDLISDIGYGPRIGKVLMTDNVEDILSIAEVQQYDGLPDFEMVIAPMHSQEQSMQGVFVDQSSVFVATLALPVEANRWFVATERAYNDPMEMLEWVKRFVLGA